MIKLLILIATILFGALWGTVQGMVMIQHKDEMAKSANPEWYNRGVRNHRWFGIYHRLCLYCAIAGAELSILLADHLHCFIWLPLPQAFQCSVFLAGCALLGWEASESMYSYARYRKWIGQGESIEIADFETVILNRQETLNIHISRLFGGIALVVSTLLMNVF